jgi:hypothetical protein
MKITIECESFEELFNYVQKVAGTAWETPAPAPAEPKRTRTKKAESTQALPTAAPAAPAPAPAPEIMPAPVPVAPAAPIVTREACAKAAANLMRTNPAAREQLKGILTGYGVNSIPTIPEIMLPDFAEKIRALGGTV